MTLSMIVFWFVTFSHAHVAKLDTDIRKQAAEVYNPKECK